MEENAECHIMMGDDEYGVAAWTVIIRGEGEVSKKIETEESLRF